MDSISKSFLILLSIISYSTSHSVPPLYSQPVMWQRTYGGPYMDYGYSIVQTPDGGYIAAGRKDVAPFYARIFVMRLNALGDTLWTRVFTGGQAIKVEETNDGNYIILGPFSRMIKINIAGDTLWTTEGNATRHMFSIKATPDNGYILSGRKPIGSYRYAPYLLKVNSTGLFQWERTYTSGITDGHFTDITLSGNEFVMSGNYSDNDTITDKLFVMKTDSQGNQVWWRRYDSLRYTSVTSLVNSPDGFIGGWGGAGLFKFDSAGFMQWFKSYDTYPRLGDCKQVVRTIDGGYAFVGGWDSTGNLSLFVRLLKTDSLGNELWHNSYGFNDADDGYGIRQTSDSGFILIGIRFGFNWDDIYIIKTDKFGNTSPYIGIKPLSGELPSEYKLYQNYPNPFNSSTMIKYEIPKPGSVNLTVFDILGREVKVIIDEQQKPGLYVVRLNADILSSGVYIYKITVNNFSQARKLIILK